MKNKRLVARVTVEQEKAIQSAAELEGISVSDFIRIAATREAHKTIEQYSVIRVSMNSANKMLKALDEVKK